MIFSNFYLSLIELTKIVHSYITIYLITGVFHQNVSSKKAESLPDTNIIYSQIIYSLSTGHMQRNLGTKGSKQTLSPTDTSDES